MHRVEFKVLKNQFAFMKNTLAYSERVLFCNKRFNALLFVEIKEIANTFKISYSGAFINQRGSK